jgi:hypothetical protein
MVVAAVGENQSADEIPWKQGIYREKPSIFGRSNALNSQNTAVNCELSEFGRHFRTGNFAPPNRESSAGEQGN